MRSSPRFRLGNINNMQVSAIFTQEEETQSCKTKVELINTICSHSQKEGMPIWYTILINCLFTFFIPLDNLNINNWQILEWAQDLIASLKWSIFLCSWYYLEVFINSFHRIYSSLTIAYFPIKNFKKYLHQCYEKSHRGLV